MKVCAQCHQQVNDFEDFCPRCGSSNLMDAQQRPPQQRPPQQRPPQQRPPQQGGYYDGQRPPQQRPPQGAPMGGQRPPQQGGYYDGQRIPQGAPMGGMNGQRPPQGAPMGGQRPPQQGTVINGQRPPQQGTVINGQRQDQDNFDDFDLDIDDGAKKGKKGKKKPKKNNYNEDMGTCDTSFGTWLKFYLTMLIPFYNIFVFFRALIGSVKVPKSITNCIRASLVYSLIITLFTIILYAVSIASILG